MTNERLEQILKQAFTSEINESEIQIQRKVRTNKMKREKMIQGGVVACAVLSLVVTGVFSGGGQELKNENLFVITAYAEELPEEVTSGDVVTLSAFPAGFGSSKYLDGRFAIFGQNIEKVKILTDKCNIYTVNSLYKDDTNYEHFVIQGNTYEGAYDDELLFGMSVPEELWSNNDDIQAAFHEDVDQVNGAILTIEVTFADGSTEVHHYRLNTGKIYVPADENGTLQWDKLTRFLTVDEERGEIQYTYGYLMEKID